MKKTIILGVSIFILVSVQEVVAQEKARFGLRVGYTSSVFSASVNSESSSKGGINIGAYVDFKTGEKFHIQPELNYSVGQDNDFFKFAKVIFSHRKYLFPKCRNNNCAGVRRQGNSAERAGHRAHAVHQRTITGQDFKYSSNSLRYVSSS